MTKPSPLPWRKDQLNNIYDNEGRMIFKACAFRELGQGVLPENDVNAQFVVDASLFAAIIIDEESRNGRNSELHGDAARHQS
jgi:hypothetical protein